MDHKNKMRNRSFGIWISVIGLTLLVLISVLSMTGLLYKIYGGQSSKSLTLKTTKEPKQIRKDYVNATGIISFADDKGYATEIRTLDENGRNVLQAYYDENGEPAMRPAGYHAIAREYNDEGKNDKVVYLGTDLKPMTVNGGYSVILKTWNAQGLAEQDSYYDEDMRPVQHMNGYYALFRKYDEEGKLTEQDYLDAEGQLTNRRNGYAIERRYYDAEGKLAEQRYFDKNGNPATIGRMQYGILHEDGQKIYLDEDGSPIVRLDTFLTSHPLLVFLAAIILLVFSVTARGKIRIMMLTIYIVFILYMTLVHREAMNGRYNLILFASYRRFFYRTSTQRQILYNIWLFVPLGALLWKPGNAKFIWFIPVVLSIGIEMMQYVLRIGFCEIDDVMSNGLGGLLGCGFTSAVWHFRKQRN